MNTLIKNKKKALRKAKVLRHTMSRFTLSGLVAVSRCLTCGMMLYIAGAPSLRLYKKTVSGEASRQQCLGRHYTVAEAVEYYYEQEGLVSA